MAFRGVRSSREPACLVMELLDGSCPAGPANQRGPAVEMMFYDEKLPDEASYIERGLAEWRGKERVEHECMTSGDGS